MKSARPHAGNALPSKVSSIAPIVRFQPPYDVRRQAGLPISALDFGNSTYLVGCETNTAARCRRCRQKAPWANPTRVRPVHQLPCRPEMPARSCSLHQSDKGEPTAVASPGRLRTAPDPTSGPAPRRSWDSIRDEGRLTALTVQGQTWKFLVANCPCPGPNSTRPQWIPGYVQLQPRGHDPPAIHCRPSEPCSGCPSPTARVQHHVRLCAEVRNSKVQLTP